jgi:C4-dicarboxylate-specific signal transduction histidine kinase
VLFLGLMSIGGLAYHREREQAEQKELRDLRFLSERVASQIDAYLVTNHGLVRHLALARDVREYLQGGTNDPVASESFNQWLHSHVSDTSDLSAVFVVSLKGDIIASSDRSFIGHNIAFRYYVQEALKGRPSTSDWVIGSVTRTPRVFSSCPAYVEGRIAGVVVTEVTVDPIAQAVESLKAAGRHAYLVNEKGIVLVHSDSRLNYHSLAPLGPETQRELREGRQFLGREIPQLDISQNVVEAYRTALVSGEAQTVHYNFEAAEKWAVIQPIKQQRWVVGVSVPQSQVEAPARKALEVLILEGLLVGAIVFVAAWLIIRRLLLPIQKLSEAMARFAAGEGAARSPVSSEDEIGQLSGEFNAMASMLNEQHVRLNELVEERTRHLTQSRAEVRSLKGMIPICSYCKNIRDDRGAWQQLEEYIRDRSEAEFSHGICPQCMKRHFPDHIC